MKMYSREILFNLLNNNGVFFDENNLDQPLEMDSITFITLIVDIENTFEITYPEKYMAYDTNLTFLWLEEVVQSLLLSQSIIT